MAQPQHTSSLTSLEEALTVLFCLIDEAYTTLNPRGAYRYETLKHLSDSEVITLALFQQLRGVESERSFLRDCERFFSLPVPGCSGAALPFLVQPTHKEAQALLGVRKRRAVLSELVGEAETLLIDSTLCFLSSIRARSTRVRGLYGRRVG
jgi:hypothetical protein